MVDWLLDPYHSVMALRRDGGPWVFWIFANGVVMWTIVFERIIYYSRVLPRQSAALLAEWNARPDHVSWCSRQIRNMMISRLNGDMTANMPLLSVLVPLAPLLGLIGTVSGMLEVFDSMALRGSADARTMASGVSEAMICTMSGLAVSITGLYPVYYFTNRARRETEMLADHFGF
jgi:biopolymer transport protein ExbB